MKKKKNIENQSHIYSTLNLYKPQKKKRPTELRLWYRNKNKYITNMERSTDNKKIIKISIVISIALLLSWNYIKENSET